MLINKSLINQKRLNNSLTINVTNTLTAAQIQNLINSVPKNLNGNTLTLQFADGEYDLGASYLNFTGFTNGLFKVQGNLADTTLSNTKNVSLTTTSTGLYFSNCSTEMSVTSLKITSSASSYNHSQINAYKCPTEITVSNCALLGVNSLYGSGLRVNSSTVYAYNTLTGNCNYGYYSQRGNLYLYGCDVDASNLPRVTLCANLGNIFVNTNTITSGSLGLTTVINGGSVSFPNKIIKPDVTLG